MSLFFLTPSRSACDSLRFIKFVLFSFLSLKGVIDDVDSEQPSSAEMVTAKSARCFTTPSKLVFLLVFGVAVGVVLLEALDTLLIKSVLPDPESLKDIYLTKEIPKDI